VTTETATTIEPYFTLDIFQIQTKRKQLQNLNPLCVN